MAGGAYAGIAERIAAGRCVVLDGGVGTELPPAGDADAALGERPWSARGLLDAPDAVLDVHRRYVAAGCHVISTATWGLASALVEDGQWQWDARERDAPVHWMDLARRGLRLAHQGRREPDSARDAPAAVAFSLNADLDSDAGRETIRLLERLFADEPEPPDLILLETLSLLGPSLEATVDALLEVGLPVWLSFRRCRHGVCGVYGEHWGGPEGDAFGRAARRFERAGVAALLVNCIPPDHVRGMLGYLRDFTDLPLGAYPNLGYLTERGWRSDPGVDGAAYAELARGWREEGAQIIGGCCGVGPVHIAAAGAALAGTRAGRPGHDERWLEAGREGVPAATWSDQRRRPLYPLPFPDLTVEPGVFLPGEPSLMAWRYLFREGVGARQRCLDVGCGTGILAVQLALNGATHVHAIDVDDRAVANTLANAFRNSVEHRVSAARADLFPWLPEERYEVVVASLIQRPAHPRRALTGHRPTDYWGRILLDELIAKLPRALAPEGVAYLVQLSVLSQERTAGLLARAGFRARVVDYTLAPLARESEAGREHLAAVEGLTDAYHLRLGRHELVVAYLLEVTAA